MDPEWLQNIPFEKLFAIDAELVIHDRTFIVTSFERGLPGNYNITLSEVGVVGTPSGETAEYDPMEDLLVPPESGGEEDVELPSTFLTAVPEGWPNG